MNVTLVTETGLIERSQFPRVTFEELQANIVSKKFVQHDLLTICILTLANGFTVVGKSACAVPGNFKLDVGQRLAEQDAIGQVWPLMGYELKTKVAMALAARPASIPNGKTYVGTKVIHATPMNRLAYNELRGWTLSEDENGEDEGYLVEYTDSDGQTRIFDGYISWSPKDVFERAYQPMDIHGQGSQGGLTWKDRLDIEVEEVSERLEKLNVFVEGPLFKSLPDEQQNLLTDQLIHMSRYFTILNRRLGREVQG